jgi:heme/copper-type cytochrome/quinol oxidase subunit 2
MAGAAFRPARDLHFWITYIVCFAVGGYVPYKLVWMTPTKPSTLNEQTWNMVIRFGVGYFLMVTAWLVLCAAIMRASDGDPTVASGPEPEPIGAAPVS